jgi:peptidoglycan/LPS O-acetylase OafA/YrhL
MRFTKESIIATGLVAATVVPYLGYATGIDVPLVEDARGLGFIGLVFGAIAWFVLGPDAFGPRRLGVGGGVLAAALAVTAAVLETGTASSLFLGAFVVVMVAMLVTALVRAAGPVRGRRPRRRMAAQPG